MSRVVVTGGAGFVGSNLCELLVRRGDTVVCVDDLSTGRRENLAALVSSGAVELVEIDLCAGVELEGPVEAVYHLACPASPVAYGRRPLETLAVGSRGTQAALELALKKGARLVLASTSEVYGEPLVHPQDEGYFGNVNPIGPRSVYDEAKRFSEALTAAYRRERGLDTGIVRIFNTYGPRMRPDDGRVVSSFVVAALTGEPLVLYGDGSQTRSLCYVDDLVEALVAMAEGAHPGPINLGNDEETTVEALAELVVSLTGSSSRLVHEAARADDPTRRQPAIELSQKVLSWCPRTGLEEGLRATIAWFEDELATAATLRPGPPR